MPIDAYDLKSTFEVDDSQVTSKVPRIAQIHQTAAAEIVASQQRIGRAAEEAGLTYNASVNRYQNAAGQFVSGINVQRQALGQLAIAHIGVDAAARKADYAKYSNDVSRFSQALKQNSVAARQGADDFLKLLGPMAGAGLGAREASASVGKVAEILRVLGSSAVVAEGPLGGVSSRLRALGADVGELGAFGPTGFLVLGLTAGAIGAAALAVAIFEMAHKAAEAGKEILTVSQKTNLATETISAFKVAAELSGTTLAAVGNKLAGFNVALGQAQQHNKVMEKSFTDMGVVINQTSEGALSQFLKKFNEMGPTAQRNALEARIFRDRTGELIPLLIDMGGSLDAAKKQAYDLGLSFDEISARSAKEFEERIKLAKLGVEGLSEQIGMRSIPAIESAFSDLSKALGLQQNSWRAWGEYIGNLTAGLVIEVSSRMAAIKQAIAITTNFFPTAFGQIGRISNDIVGSQSDPNQSNYSALKNEIFGAPNAQNDPTGWSSMKTPQEAYEAERASLIRQTGSWKPPATSGIADTFKPAGPGGGKHKKGADRNDEELALDRELLRGKETLWKTEKDEYDQLLKTKKISTETYVADLITLEDARHAAMAPIYAKEMAAAEAVRGDDIKKAREVLKVKNDIAEEDYKHNKIVADAKSKLEEEVTAVIKIQTEARAAVMTEYHSGVKASIESLGSFHILNAEQVATQLAAIDRAEYNTRLASLHDEQGALLKGKTVEEQILLKHSQSYATLQAKIDELDKKWANTSEANARRRRAAHEDDLSVLRQYAAQLSAMNSQTSLQMLAAARSTAETAGGSGAISQHQMHAQITLIDIAAEAADFAAKKSQLLFQIQDYLAHITAMKAAAAANDANIRMGGIGWTPAEIAEASAQLKHWRDLVEATNKQIEADTATHEAKLKAIRLQGQEELNARLKQISSSIIQTWDKSINDLFTKGWKQAFLDVITGFAQMIEQMALQLAESKLLQMLQKGTSVGGQQGAGGGWIQKLLGIGIGALGGGLGGSMGGGGIPYTAPPMASGGSWTVGGNPGIDQNVVSFRASRGERVTVETPSQQSSNRSGGMNVMIVNQIAAPGGRVAPESIDQMNRRMLSQLHLAGRTL